MSWSDPWSGRTWRNVTEGRGDTGCVMGRSPPAVFAPGAGFGLGLGAGPEGGGCKRACSTAACLLQPAACCLPLKVQNSRIKMALWVQICVACYQCAIGGLVVVLSVGPPAFSRDLENSKMSKGVVKVPLAVPLPPLPFPTNAHRQAGRQARNPRTPEDTSAKGSLGRGDWCWH